MGSSLIYLLDTNVVSQQTVERPHPAAFDFLETIPVDQSYLSVITLMEIRAGIEKLKPGSAKRAVLEPWLTRRIPKQFPQRILPVTAEIADAAGRLLAAEKKDARTPAISDLLIAATAKVYGMTVVTMNRKHFETLDIPLAVL